MGSYSSCFTNKPKVPGSIWDCEKYTLFKKHVSNQPKSTFQGWELKLKGAAGVWHWYIGECWQHAGNYLCAVTLEGSPLVPELMHSGTFHSSQNLFPYLITGKSEKKSYKAPSSSISLSTGVAISNSSSSYIAGFT